MNNNSSNIITTISFIAAFIIAIGIFTTNSFILILGWAALAICETKILS